jgi:hypothetical protein
MKKKNISRKHFIEDVEKRFKTIMIGSLARMEDTFGYLWGHNKNSLEKNQVVFREMWEDLRTDILNHGNNQMRLALEDMVSYLESLDKYEYKFIFVDNDKNNKENR